MVSWKEHKFKSYGAAKKKQQQMKKCYGYTPSVFSVRNPKTDKRWYAVVQPKGLKKR